MKERVFRLIDVKSIVTLALIGVLCFMTIMGNETSELFNSSVMLVLGFFFGKNTKDNFPENDIALNTGDKNEV